MLMLMIRDAAISTDVLLLQGGRREEARRWASYYLIGETQRCQGRRDRDKERRLLMSSHGRDTLAGDEMMEFSRFGAQALII